MSRTFHHGQRAGRRDYHIRVRGIRRQPADLRRLARALIDLAQAEAEAAAQADHRRGEKESPDNSPSAAADERSKTKRGEPDQTGPEAA